MKSQQHTQNSCYVSTPDSPVAVIIMPTDEELMIAKQTSEVVVHTGHP